MSTIKTLIKALECTETEHDKKKGEITAELNALYFEKFKDWKALQHALRDIEVSTEYSNTESGIVTFVRFEAGSLDSYELYALNEYVGEHGVYLETDMNTIICFQGDCIVVNSEGDVFLSDGVGSKLILRADSIEGEKGTEEYRLNQNAWIEQYMEEEGHFPAVLSEDYYGDLTPISTLPPKPEKKKKKKKKK